MSYHTGSMGFKLHREQHSEPFINYRTEFKELLILPFLPSSVLSVPHVFSPSTFNGCVELNELVRDRQSFLA